MSDNYRAPGEQTATPRLIVILGGARSGKSAFAERLAASSRRFVAFIATATAGDEEMRERIARHRASCPKEWQTLEEPLDLARAVRIAGDLADVLLLDCITLWLANWLSQRFGTAGGEEFASSALFFEEALLKEVGALFEVVNFRLQLRH